MNHPITASAQAVRWDTVVCEACVVGIYSWASSAYMWYLYSRNCWEFQLVWWTSKRVAIEYRSLLDSRAHCHNGWLMTADGDELLATGPTWLQSTTNDVVEAEESLSAFEQAIMIDVQCRHYGGSLAIRCREQVVHDLRHRRFGGMKSAVRQLLRFSIWRLLGVSSELFLARRSRIFPMMFRFVIER